MEKERQRDTRKRVRESKRKRRKVDCTLREGEKGTGQRGGREGGPERHAQRIGEDGM